MRKRASRQNGRMTNAGPNAEIAAASSCRVGLRLVRAGIEARLGLVADGRSDSPARL
jgi:hypothetical protein